MSYCARCFCDEKKKMLFFVITSKESCPSPSLQNSGSKLSLDTFSSRFPGCSWPYI